MTDRNLTRRIKYYRNKVNQEIRKAIKNKEPWTKLRKFINKEERVGAFRCSPLPKPKECTGISEYVSYSTHINGRIVVCDGCYKRRNRNIME